MPDLGLDPFAAAAAAWALLALLVSQSLTWGWAPDGAPRSPP